MATTIIIRQLMFHPPRKAVTPVDFSPFSATSLPSTELSINMKSANNQLL